MNRLAALRLGSRPPPRYGFRAVDMRVYEAPGRLVFTERLLIGVLMIAGILTCSFPIFNVQLSITFLKHVPLILLSGIAILHFIGLSMNRNRVDAGGALRATWPFVALAIFAIVGSSVARWSLRVEETFIVFGIYLLIVPIAAMFPITKQDVSHWPRALSTLWTVLSVITVVGAAAHPDTAEAFHEGEYLVLSGFFVLVYRSRNTFIRTLAMLAMIAVAVVNHKLTGYIVGAIGLTFIVLHAGWERTGEKWRTIYKIGALVAVCCVALLLIVGYFAFRDYLPSGNSNVRLKQYDQALTQFYASPIWGDAYTGPSGENFAEAGRVLNIPTHSDVLDMLKHGGLIAFALFAYGYSRLIRLFARAAAASQANRATSAFFLTMQFFLIGAAVTFSLNPILLKGPYLVMIWGYAGLAVGLALRVLKPSSGRAP